MRKAAQSIESMREYFHSLHDTERAEVIELLSASSESSDSTRELIHIFEECQWRDTRLQIIRTLSRNPNQRGLEFLFRLARTPDDLPIAEAAIWSLGQSHQRLAALFLVNFYTNCDELLRPAVVGALGQIPDRTLAKEFLTQLQPAVQAKNNSLVKNLVLTLGELKVKEALPQLQELALQKHNTSISLSALIAIGKIARDPKLLVPLELRFSQDLFEYQLFTSVKTQIQFRSQWKLEDYLSKLFSGQTVHPSLPYELSHFKPEDVKEGFKMFSGAEHLERLCLALSRVDFSGLALWYQELFDLKKLDVDRRKLVLSSISAHLNPQMSLPLSEIIAGKFPDEPELFPLWLKAVVMAVPDADGEAKKYLDDQRFFALPEEVRIASINEIFHFGLIVQAQPARLQKAARILEGILERDSSHRIQARCLRALGQLKFASKKAAELVKQCLSEPQEGQVVLLQSCFQYLEKCPEKNLSELLLRMAPQPGKTTEGADPAKWGTAYLRCLSALPNLPTSSSNLDDYLRVCLKAKGAPLRKMEALRLVAVHRRSGLLAEVVECLKDEERVQLAALITLREIGNEGVADAVAPLLVLDHRSLSGRALDALSSLPGMRSKRVILDYLTDHSLDLDVCDKIIRCLRAPENFSQYFVDVVDDLLKRYPEHPLLDGLLRLREKLSIRISGSTQDRVLPKGVDIQAIDVELSGKIAGYNTFDEFTKSALRSAEIPYLHREMFDEYVDKASSVVEYCKAVDLLLENSLGKKMLFPRIESALHEFQNVLHAAGLNEDYANGEHVIRQLELEKHFSVNAFPLHKMLMIAKDFRTGRVIRDQFKTMDGLRAWAIILLLFCRRIQGVKPLLTVKAGTDDQLVSFSKRLMALQDVRNPVAHRQTVVKFSGLDSVRNEVFGLLSLFPKII